MTLYLIKRGPRPDYHKAPFHPVVLCAKKPVAKWEAGWTGDKAWVWTRETHEPYGGWLLERWEGLDIDYGHLVRGCTLPDGTEVAFWHQHSRPLPWELMRGAVWWDDRRMPQWVQESGAIYPPDEHSQQQILDTIANLRADRKFREDCRRAGPNGIVVGFRVSGFGRPVPDFWPKGLMREEWDAREAGPGITQEVAT